MKMNVQKDKKNESGFLLWFLFVSFLLLLLIFLKWFGQKKVVRKFFGLRNC